VTVRVKRKAGAPAVLVRAGTDREMAMLASLYESEAEGARFSLRRDAEAMQFALTKKRLFAGLAPAGLRQLEFFVTEEGTRPVAYVVITVNAHGWTLEEAGDRDPTGARVGAMLQVLVAREPSQEPPLIRAWWPRTMQVPPQLELINRTDPHDLFMVRSLGDAVAPARPEEVFYWRSDVF
jgi:hypothetical protein